MRAHLDARAPAPQPLDAAEALVFDSTLFHGGGRNVGGARRSLLSISLAEPAPPGESDGDAFDPEQCGSTSSIFPEYRGRFRLVDFIAEN